ncbi:MAG: hypothetical protein J6T45_08875 [Fibrobacterales bacterium]|nr:hypothetical protein [Fibrobacterales bacterium]
MAKRTKGRAAGLLALCALALLSGCSSQQQLALARVSNEQAHAAAGRVETAETTPALDEGAKALAEADSLLAKGERGEYGPFAKEDRLQDAYIQGELAAAAFLKAGAEQETRALEAKNAETEARIANETKTLEDYEALLRSLRDGRAE